MGVAGRITQVPMELEMKGGHGALEEKGVRVLNIMFERSGGCWRRLDSTSAEMSDTDLLDFQLEGPRSRLWFVQQLGLAGLHFRLHRERWIKASGVRQKDRSIFNHRAFWSRYDQINVANLAGAETFIRRLVATEEACHGRPDGPNYEHAEHMSGRPSSRPTAALCPPS